MAFESQLADLANLHQDFFDLQAIVSAAEQDSSFALNAVTTAISLWLPIVVQYEALANSLGGGAITPPTPTPTYTGFVVEGDSIDAGGGTNTQSWPTQFQALTGIPVTSAAVQGDTLSNMLNNYGNAGGIGQAYSNTYNNLILGGGTNDLALDDQSVNRMKELFYGLCHKARETGFQKIWIMTLLPRTLGVGNWDQSREDRRIAINAAILSEYAYYGADGVIDRTVGFTTADTFDGIHPSNAGALKIAQTAKSVISLTTSFVPKGVVFEGDSITAGTGANTDPYPAQWSRLTSIASYNIGYPGDQIRALLNNFDSQAAPKFNVQTCDTYMFNGGSNDISDNGPDKNNIVDVIQLVAAKARAKGFKIIVSTILPRGFNTANEAIRTSVNQWLRTNWRTIADGFVDFAAVVTDTSGMFDGVHPNNVTSGVMATEVAKTLTAATVAPAVPDGITDSNGSIDTAKWAAMANNYWTADAVNYRLGPPSAPIANRPTWFGPYADKKVGNGFPPTRIYQIGEEFIVGYDDFSSTELHIGFVPDNPGPRSAGGRIGFAGVQGISFSNATGSIKPIENWTRNNNEGMDGVEAYYWRQNGYPNLSKPTCVAHGYGRPGWAVQSIGFFQDGSMCTVGTNTDANVSFGKLPAGLIPTSAAIMSANECALVTVWNTNLNRGEVALVVLCGLGHGSSIEDPDSGEPDGWWGEWNRAYPGLQNLGNNVFFKYVGSIVLPGMMAPTGISATTGQHRSAYLGGGNGLTNGNLSNWVEDESVRQRWCKPNGDRRTNLVRQGMFMVWSRTEKKVQFFDMRPWFDYINKYYFGTRADFLKTRDIGQNANQWPFAFSVAPEQTPTFIKSFDLPSAPTAGCVFKYCYNEAHRQAWLALDSGVMYTYNTGDYAHPYDGVADAYPGQPNLLVKVAETPIDPGTTSITQTCERGANSIIRDHTRELFLMSRTTKYLTRMDMVNPTGPGVVKWRTTDSRWVDPVYAEDMENHGTESYVIEVADFSGKTVHALGWGPIIFHTINGKTYPLRNGEAFNYFGGYPVEGKPFVNLGANVS